MASRIASDNNRSEINNEGEENITEDRFICRGYRSKVQRWTNQFGQSTSKERFKAL